MVLSRYAKQLAVLMVLALSCYMLYPKQDSGDMESAMDASGPQAKGELKRINWRRASVDGALTVFDRAIIGGAIVTTAGCSSIIFEQLSINPFPGVADGGRCGGAFATLAVLKFASVVAHSAKENKKWVWNGSS